MTVPAVSSETVFQSIPIENNDIPPSNWAKIASKIGKVAKIIFLSAVGITLFFINSNLFAMGFIVGIIWSDKTEEAINKVRAIWQKQPWQLAGLIGCAAFLSLPVTLATAAFYFGARIGNSMEKSAMQQN